MRDLLWFAALALCACTPPPAGDLPISPEAAARPWPNLEETAMFSSALAGAAPAATALQEVSNDLSARAAALRTRAAALDAAQVLDPAARARLQAAGAAGSP